jgi:hypothetical protein
LSIIASSIVIGKSTNKPHPESHLLREDKGAEEGGGGGGGGGDRGRRVKRIGSVGKESVIERRNTRIERSEKVRMSREPSHSLSRSLACSLGLAPPPSLPSFLRKLRAPPQKRTRTHNTTITHAQHDHHEENPHLTGL